VAILAGFGVLSAAFLVIALSTPDHALAAFLLLWVAGVAWTAYWALDRTACEVGIAGDSTLRWSSVAGSHTVPLSAIRGVSTPWGVFGAGLRRIDVDGGFSPLLIVSPGFADVLAMIERSRPNLEVRTSWYDALALQFGKRTLTWRRL
jgi:hypothetical protein